MKDHSRDKLNTIQQKWLGYILAFIIAMLGLIAIIYATRWGPWVKSDSTGYIAVARNLLNGHGLGLMRASGDFVYTAHVPPAYMLLLALWGWANVDLITGARAANAMLFAITLWGLGTYLYYSTRRILLSASVGLVLLTSALMLYLYSGVMSEGLFLTLVVGSLLFLLHFFHSDKISHLCIASILCGLSIFTRYIGISLMLTGALVIIFLSQKKWKRRFQESFLFVVLAMLPILLWMLWLKTIDSAVRTVNFDMSGLWNRMEPIRGAFVDFFWDFIPIGNSFLSIPYRAKIVILLVISASFIATTTILILKKPGQKKVTRILDPGYLIALTFTIFTACYLFALTITFLFTRPTPDLSARILSPVYVAVWVSLFSFLFTFADLYGKTGAVRLSPLLLTGLVIISNMKTSFAKLEYLHENGEGYSTRRWQTSETIRAMTGIPSSAAIITNDSDAVLLFLNRPSYDLPEILLDEPRDVFLRFGDDRANGTERIFREQGAALVLFRPLEWQLRPIYGDDTQARIQSLTEGLTVFFDSYDGSIYFYPTPEGPSAQP